MNIYKKTLFAATVIAIGIIFADHTSVAEGNVAGAPIGKTGSPGDASNCTGCHAGVASTTAGLITSSVPVTGYIPGTTYTITATITASGINKFGFEASPQNGSGTQKGTLVVTNATETKLLGTTAKYITHKSAGTSGTGSKTWTFDWVAPAAGNGNVTMYGAFVAANGNGTNTGDQVFLSSLLIAEDLTAGIAGVDNENGIVLYPNPANEKMFLKLSDADKKIVSIQLTDITGKSIKTISYDNLPEDKSIDIADLPGGMYVLSIVSESGTSIKKFIKK